ncbi:LOW QUALITY PROTEIN: peroxisomal biogenesis factor 19 [Drosophila eugracilis]|uniref:LOW QUALITY PROTEIN: peroxisomal biogenesis factor 19 n=1 Tax=Drosophila eugracilis TaxID=29029 RepID=UPI001BD9D089|nr:LOW QUALITY PROTEIN: peroxisomal biogenesis factor 19 [Drosophila eugracilis]
MSDEKQKSDELDDLLDSCLQDFDKSGAGDSKEKASSDDAANAEGADTSDDPEAFFLEKAQMLADRMNTLFGGPNTPSGDIPPLPQDPDQIMSGFKKMAEAAALTLSGENSATDEDVSKYSDSISQALKGLQEGSENLTAPASENDIASMFGSLNLEGAGDGDGNMFLPFMEGMMQSLLSAEILLPSIRELLEKYPKYLEENEGKLSAEDKERYLKQMELYKVIEGHLQSEKPDDSAAVKREKFRVVLDDMRKLQDFGQPPLEILAETGGDLPFGDPASLAAAGGPGPQCPTM